MKGYAELLKQIREDHEKQSSGLDKDSKVLIIDGLNSFIRVFSASPLANDDGDHIGG
jgi:5'-3' exonuclease